MKTRLFLSLMVVCLLFCNIVYSQAGESKFKMVVVNLNEKKIAQLFPSFQINNLGFTDLNMNQLLDAKETGAIRFYLKNSGTILLQELNVKLSVPDSITGITFTKDQSVKSLNPGDSVLVNIPLSADDKIKSGLAIFNILISDTKSDSVKLAHVNIPTKELTIAPEFTWITPAANIEKTEFAVVDVSGIVKTKSNITGLKIYINDQVPEDSKAFDVIATENPEEFRISRKIALNEGDNEIRIEATTAKGATTSEVRTINYYVQKIDQSYTEKRLALVIGNGNYLNGNTLQNPTNDAKAIATALKEVGFTVMLYLNSDAKTMRKAMDDFGDKLKGYTVGLFYYAGHGMQVKGNNYLIPVDASLKVEQDVEYDCLDAGRVLGKMEAAGSVTNIVVLDACRDNPFARSWGSSRSAGQQSGLAFMNAPSGSIVAYATSPGKTASDGSGKNGLYTEAFLQYMKVPGLSLLEFFQNVRGAVEKKSNKTQTPWEMTSLKGNFYFKVK